ncbi:uncharacterized protein B0P05DRAFT_578511 [Gilbertella persicaria]|uniref:uncharacterized protein n=1 Tax=Gilbertella persicaria TaxID=101096 RepID=UPI00222103D0|nr:uncharacterized protein B0P05DRAFT_578511 [Gilbertella persicaria]KAI8084049.1 hypothetical protein B0P05DRAFT_578511 [Gilbertella persicaria]
MSTPKTTVAKATVKKEETPTKLTPGQKLLKTMTAQKAAKKALMKGVSNTRISFDEEGNEKVETVVKKTVAEKKSRPAMKKPEPTKKRSADKIEEEKETPKPAPKKAKKPKKSKIEVLAYVRLFAQDRENWKFKKMLQIWLLSNLYKLPEDEFDHVLEYLKNLQGSAREKTKKEAEAKIPSITTTHALTSYANVATNDFDDFDAEKLLAQAPTTIEPEQQEEESLEVKRAKRIVKILS